MIKTTTIIKTGPPPSRHFHHRLARYGYSGFFATQFPFSLIFTFFSVFLSLSHPLSHNPSTDASPPLPTGHRSGSSPFTSSCAAVRRSGTLSSDCTLAPPPVQDKATRTNESIFDPCRWTDCGGGSCNKTSPFTYSCTCAEGYYNLFNVSAFSCSKQCSIGMDCKDLGISTLNTTTPPVLTVFADSSQAGLNLLGNHYWLIILVMSLAMVQ